MRRLHSVGCGIWLCGLLAGMVHAETFQLNDGRALTGDVVAGSARTEGVLIKTGDGKYERVPWANFSQDDLKKFKADPKVALLVEPLITVTTAERGKKTEVVIKGVERLDRPQPRSLFSALSGSSVGLVVLLLLYAANLYAAYEVAFFRAQPTVLVCGVAAVLPVLGPLAFLLMPRRVPKLAEDDEDEELEEEPPTRPAPRAASRTAATAPAAVEPVSNGLEAAEADAAPSETPQTQVFRRGQFTFNRRFFETKFQGFFGMAVVAAEKNLVLVVQSEHDVFVARRILRIGASDLHVEVMEGRAAYEVTVPFGEIQEIHLKHKDA